MDASATLEVHITQPIAPVGKKVDLIVRPGETDYLAWIPGSNRELDAS